MGVPVFSLQKPLIKFKLIVLLFAVFVILDCPAGFLYAEAPFR